MAVSATMAKELDKFFQNINKIPTVNNTWEGVLLDNAQRVSTPLVMQMLNQMGINKNTTTPFRMFENACGAGVVAPVLQQMIKPEVLKQSSILCGDFSEPAVGLAKKRIESEGWINTEAQRIDGQNTGLADGQFTHVTTNIGYHVIPDSEKALDESIRILKPGGILGFTTWHKEAGWIDDVREAFLTFPFEAPCVMALQTTPWGKWYDVNWIRKTLQAKGLQDIQVNIFAHLTQVDNSEHFAAHFSMMIEWIMSSSWSEELRKEHPREEVIGLMKEFLEKKYEGKPWNMSWISVIATGRV
ncbi:S-adenosyl-L-methionine-dependent methyltransferase [Cladorrhinum sp. PSN332]|nr:S-adenosyl-L-methionine-dependent methyltransferase [Cladorrhinum sp. PSN332]